VERLVFSDAVSLEVDPVKRKDIAEMPFLRECHKGSVGQIHWLILVFIHKGAHSATLRWGGNLYMSLLDQIPERILRPPTTGVAEQVHGLGERRPRR
jgi:hypothetical protein